MDPRALFEEESLPVDRRVLFALGSAVLSTLLLAIGSYGGAAGHSTLQFLVSLVVTVAVTAALFRVVVPRFEGGTGGAAFVLSLIALASLLLFWLGLPVPLAGAATYLAMDAGMRRDVRGDMRAGALAISTLVVVIAVLLALLG